MTEKEKEVFAGFLEKTYGLKIEDVAGLYNEAGELTTVDLLLQKDSEKVARFKTEKADQFNAGVKKAHDKIEKHLKEKFGVTETDLIGTELIDHVFETQTAELQEKISKKFNPDEIEKHPAFIAKRTEWEKTKQQLLKEADERLAARESEWNQKITLDQVAKNALNILEANYLLPENADRAIALKEVFINEIKKGNYTIQDGGDPVLLDKDGKPLEDDHGKLITFKDFAENQAGKFFDKKIAQQRGNAGNQPTPPSGQPIVIKDQSEFKVKMAEATTPEDRAAVMKAAKVAGLV